MFCARHDQQLPHRPIITMNPVENQSYFPFMRLPKELRLQVLRYSDLVDSRFGSQYQQFITYRFDRIQICSRHADRRSHSKEASCDHCPHILSSSLLRVNRIVHDEAYEIMLTHNLLVLESGHAQNLKFLRSLSPLVRSRIQHLDMRFELDRDFEEGAELVCCLFRDIPKFDLLIDYVGRNLNLAQLHFSLDLLDIYDYFADGPSLTRTQSVMALMAFKRISPLLIKLRGIRTFHVFLPLHIRYEYIMEKIAAGPDYDSLEDGKPPLEYRHRTACHAFRGKDEWWWAVEDCALCENAIMVDPLDDYIACCKHPERFTGVVVPPWNPYYVPGPEKEDRCLWYDHNACMEALEMASSGLLPGNQTLRKPPALPLGSQKAATSLDIIALENS